MNSITLKHDYINTLHKSIPARPYCSNTKRIKWILPRQEAVKQPYLQLNHIAIRHITFDVDHGDVWRARDIGITEPTWIASNRDKYGSHQIYTICTPIYPNSSPKARLLLRDTIDSYKEALSADRVITTQKQLSKNPLHKQWDTIWGKETTLSEMIRCMPHARIQPANTERTGILSFHDCIGIGRNTSLFDYARRYAYAWVGDTASYGELYSHILQLISKTNRNELLQHFSMPLPQKELMTIAKSIATWVWQRKSMFTSKSRGIMGFHSRKGIYTPPIAFQAETKRRQRAGAGYTNNKKRYKTEQAIVNAIQLYGKNKKVIAEKTCMHIATIYRYNHLF